MKTAKQQLDELIESGRTQAEIEKGTGVSQATISRIRSGKSEGRGTTLRLIDAFHTAHFQQSETAAA